MIPLQLVLNGSQFRISMALLLLNQKGTAQAIPF